MTLAENAEKVVEDVIVDAGKAYKDKVIIHQCYRNVVIDVWGAYMDKAIVNQWD